MSATTLAAADGSALSAPRFVVALDGSGPPVESVGGKAAALDALVAAGFPVPPSLALKADAYRSFVAHNGLERALGELSRRGEEVSSYEMERLFTTAAMPDDLADEILAAVPTIGDGLLAVRSSATSEDTKQASFAGQYDSEIGVSPHTVLSAIKRVWSSLWAPAAVAYRAHQGVDDEGLAMAVLIMPVIPAELAGVAFTVDPGGTPDHLRVELVRGLAEGLVSGRATPDVLVIPRAEPRHLTVDELGDDAGVVEQVVELALAVEELAGAPQDVEWVSVGGHVQLVQARPITVEAPGAPEDDDGFDTPALPGVTYASAGIAEMLPGVLPPLRWTIAGPLVEEAFRELLDDLGVLPHDLTGAHGVVGRFRGRAALNLDLLRATAGRVPGGSAAEMERQYFGHVVSEEDEGTPAESQAPPRHGRLATLRTLRRVLALYRRTKSDAEVVVQAAELVAERADDLTSLPGEDLLAHLANLEELAALVATAQVRAAATAAATYRGLEVLLSRHVGPAAEAATQRITAGAVGSSAAEVAFRAGEIVALVDEAGLGQVAEQHDGAESAMAALASAGGGHVVRRWELALARSGSMSTFAGPTWAEDPDAAWQAVRHHRGDHDQPGELGGAEALASLEADLTRTWHWRAIRVVTGQVVDVRRRVLRRLTDDARELLGQREATKGALLLVGGAVRRATLEIGARLADRGLLHDAAEVDLLDREELELVGPGRARSFPSRSQLVRRRTALSLAQEEGPLPRRFDSRPGPAAAGGADGGLLQGWGASTGRHTGPVKVVSDPRRAEVGEGDVLVANTTDPSWTPLLLRCGAVVVEEGGPLSHAAIIARELGLPAVLNCPGATALTDGTVVVVDGQTGTVQVLDEEAGR